MDGKRERVATRRIGGPRDYDWEEEENGRKGREGHEDREAGQRTVKREEDREKGQVTVNGKRKRRTGMGERGTWTEIPGTRL